MRTLNEHQINPANDTLHITVMDEPGHGGACHCYDVALAPGASSICTIAFQNGPIAEAGVNGVTHEVLLAILADRLRGFQSGPYACEENAAALDAIEDAQSHLMSRTRARMERGVEGTHTV